MSQLRDFEILSQSVYGHLQQINLQRASLYGPPNIRTLAATSCSRPLAAATYSGH